MKPILLALTLVGLLFHLAPRAEADTEVSLNFFYDNLSPYGSWIEVADYGYCFQPSVAVNSSDWRPYADGYWAYTDAGWTWVSYEDFGWATYHYGRWANLDSFGWVWAPGYEWGPAWVSWRTGGDFVGWAPLPPQPGEVIYEGRPISGAVDASFGIGPLYYNFVDIRYIGEPVLRGRIIEPRRNVTIINRTVNVTNITYNNSIVINNGPDLNRINQFSSRPVQRLKLERETTVGGDRRGNLNRVNGNVLVVAAPAVQRSKEKIAPRQVKTKVEKPRLERGWQGVQNKQEIETAMNKENAKNVPPPTFQPQKNRKSGEVTTNEPGAENALGSRPGPQDLKTGGKDRQKDRGGNFGDQTRTSDLQNTESVNKAQRPARVQAQEKAGYAAPARQPQLPQRNRLPEQVRPQQQQSQERQQETNLNNERKGKKKKPAYEPPPQQ